MKRLWIDVHGGGPYWYGAQQRRTLAAAGAVAIKPSSAPGGGRHGARAASVTGVTDASSTGETSRSSGSNARNGGAASTRRPPACLAERGAGGRGSAGGRATLSGSGGSHSARPARHRVSGGRAVVAALGGSPLTQRQIRDLMTRDLTPEDYELLLLLDEGIKKAPTLSTVAVARLPKAGDSDWIGKACGICLATLEEGEDVRQLPACGHTYHGECICHWLTNSKATCPLCGSAVS